jgi:glycosyltransferase involved in cell wall biosynthesis
MITIAGAMRATKPRKTEAGRSAGTNLRVLQVAAKSFTLANFALPLMLRLREAGFEVDALGGPDGFEDRLQAAGFRLHPWRMGHTFDPLTLWRARRQLADFLEHHPYDIVHTHCSFAGIVGNPVAYHRTGALIYTQHGFFVHEGLNPVSRRAWLAVEKIGLRWAHWVICVSQAERDLAGRLGVRGERSFLTVPGAGVRTEEFRLGEEDRQVKRQALRGSLGLRADETVLLTVSRLTWDKGYRDMIEAARALKAGGIQFRFLAAGPGKDEARIRGAVRQAGLETDFCFLGWRDDVVDLYCAADIFVFASHREGLPIAPIEAMASGLPVVASDIPGCREEIEHGRSGLLFRVGDAGDLAAAVRALLADRSLAERLGKRARERAQLFDLSRVLDLQLELYRRLAEGS